MTGEIVSRNRQREYGTYIHHESVSGLSATSQQDLSANDLFFTRFSTSRSPSKGEETGDLMTRGKELAARCWEEDGEFLAKDKIAEWLGGQYVFFCSRK